MNKRSGFTLVELLIVIVIIGILASIGLGSFNTAQMKSRDSKRKTNLQQIANALEIYYNDKGVYPASTTAGLIKGCGLNALEDCTWGESAFSNTSTNTTYMVKLPTDPLDKKYNYYYTTFKKLGINVGYKLYARLENTQDNEIDPDIVTQSRDCDNVGTTYVCNYGISSGNTTP